MKRRAVLPRRLGQSFAVQTAAAAGVGRSRRDAPDLDRPFYGIRATVRPSVFVDVVACYAPRLKAGHRFAGRTAMRLWGIPLPAAWRSDEELHVVVPPTAAPPRTAGVSGHRLLPARAETWTVQGVPVVDPVAALFTHAGELSVAQAVVAMDALITTSSGYPGLGPGRPMATVGEIELRLVAWGRFAGSGAIRRALPLARDRVESPKETETRLLIVGAGLPEPVVQFEVWGDGVFIARTDLAYPHLKIAIEYEGDGHRTSKEQWRVDIRRQRALEDLGWIVVRLTELDLADGGRAFLTRLRTLVADRSES